MKQQLTHKVSKKLIKKRQRRKLYEKNKNISKNTVFYPFTGGKRSFNSTIQAGIRNFTGKLFSKAHDLFTQSGQEKSESTTTTVEPKVIK